ncbi:hypothetical protein CWB96_22900, partial [Pseudoalteromonas citrea]
VARSSQSAGADGPQCEAEGLRQLPSFLDSPDVLMTYVVTIFGDTAIPYLFSNGNKVDEGTTEDARHFAKGQDP